MSIHIVSDRSRLGQTPADDWEKPEEPINEYPPEPYVPECLASILLPEHYWKLYGSALTDETILQMGAYSESDGIKLARMFDGHWPYSRPALVLPYFDRQGKRIDYQVARLFPPHVRKDGGESKYIMPGRVGNRAYFPPHPIMRKALVTPGAPLLITEGIAKTWAAVQAGVPAIGLMGLWNWQVKREDKQGPRELIPGLAEIDWRGRKVLIVADADPKRKPSVNQGTAEFARVLTERGAECILPRLPLGPRGGDDLPEKQAIDDYAFRFGDDALRQWVQEQLADAPVLNLEECRREMARARDESLVRPGVYLDAGPTGLGKSYADADCIGRADRMVHDAAGKIEGIGLAKQLVLDMRPRSLMLTNTHSQCSEAVEMQKQCGVEAVAFPKLSSDTCVRFDEAQAVMGRGLSHMKALCHKCEYREECPYIEQFQAASAADHKIATHSRAAVSLPEMAEGCTVLSLHETPLDCLRPTFVTDRGLRVVELVAGQAEHAAGDARDRGFYRHLGQIARELDGWHHGSNEPVEMPLPAAHLHEPSDLHCELNNACLELGTSPPADAMRIALGATLGKVSSIAVAVDERPDGKDDAGRDKVKIDRKLVAVTKTDLPADVTIWLNDATANRSELEAVLGRPVTDITPQGRLPLRVPVVQIIPKQDVTKSRTAEGVLPLLRGILHDLAQYKRVGLLTHRELAEKLPSLLKEPYRSRLTKDSYFGGGESRGSNRWIDECDALIVLGTPRVPPSSIREHLARIGNSRAATLRRAEADWASDWWSGVTVSGKRLTVMTPHYTNHDWHGAYCAIVRAELVQAIGRGRGILPDGVPIFVVTTENLASPDDDDGRNSVARIADRPYAPLTHAQAKMLSTLEGQGTCKTGWIASKLELNPKTALDRLKVLAQAGRIVRIGKGSGWHLP